MQTKVDRFNDWRGKKAKSERNNINSALLISDYLDSVQNLSQIKSEVVNGTERFMQLDRHGKLTTGSLVYCKLVVDESLELLPGTANKERQLLIGIKDILSKAYDSPSSAKLTDVNKLIADITALLAIKVEDIQNKEQAKVLGKSLYMMLNIVQSSLNNLKFPIKSLVNAVIDVNEKLGEIAVLIKATEVKIEELEKAIAKSAPKGMELVEYLTVQEYFNARFSAIPNGKEQESTKLTNFVAYIDTINDDLIRLSKAKAKKEEISAKIFKVQGLLNAAEQNDLNIVGRKYFLDFVASNNDLFNVLMGAAKDPEKGELMAKIILLKSPDVYQKVSSNLLYAMSWATSLVTVIYRAWVPQSIQDYVASRTPATMDSECKDDLQDLARSCLVSLKRDLKDVDKDMSDIIDGNKGLKKLLDKESIDELNQLQKANEAIKEAVNEYIKISKVLNGTIEALIKYKNIHNILNDFIRKNDGWLVKLSNFLAQFFPIFKSDTAKVIDRARVLKEQLSSFEVDYKKDVQLYIGVIENNPDLPKGLKIKFKREFDVEAAKSKVTTPTPSLNKEEVNDLMTQAELVIKVRKEFSSDKKVENGKSVTKSAQEDVDYEDKISAVMARNRFNCRI